MIDGASQSALQSVKDTGFIDLPTPLVHSKYISNYAAELGKGILGAYERCIDTQQHCRYESNHSSSQIGVQLIIKKGRCNSPCLWLYHSQQQGERSLLRSQSHQAGSRAGDWYQHRNWQLSMSFGPEAGSPIFGLVWSEVCRCHPGVYHLNQGSLKPSLSL